MEGLIFSEDLCRLCLWKNNKLFPIFSPEGELQGIPLKIDMCLPISVTREDVLPKLICSQCIYKLEMFSEFRNSCVRSEQLLKCYTSHDLVQVPACQTVVVQMQEEVKVEVQEPDPIALEQKIPFFSVIPDYIHKEATKECEPPKVENQSVTSIHMDAAEIENSNKDATSLKKQAKRNRRVVRWNNTPRKQRNKSELAVCVDLPNHGRTRHRGSIHAARILALTSSRQSIYRCKHCSKNFPSRVQLSGHLASSNCLFRYTCHYCAKIFSSAESRISHERNHRDKKNFICRICKQKFQSSFDLNVHTLLQGCEHHVDHNHQQSTVITEANMQMTQDKGIERVNDTKQHKAF